MSPTDATQSGRPGGCRYSASDSRMTTTGTESLACPARTSRVRRPQTATFSGGPAWVGNQTPAATYYVVFSTVASATTRTSHPASSRLTAVVSPTTPAPTTI